MTCDACKWAIEEHPPIPVGPWYGCNHPDAPEDMTYHMEGEDPDNCPLDEYDCPIHGKCGGHDECPRC